MHPEFYHLPIPVYQVYQPHPFLPREKDELVYLACKVNAHALELFEEATVCGWGLYQNKYPIHVIHLYVDIKPDSDLNEYKELYFSRVKKLERLVIDYAGCEMFMEGIDLDDIKLHWLAAHVETGMPGYLYDEDINIVLGRRLPDGPEHTVFWNN